MAMQMVRPIMMGVPRPAPPMMVPQQQMFVPRQQPPMFMQQRPGGPGGPPGGAPGGHGQAGGAGNMSRPDEPPNKKQKTEDNLIPEAEFLAKNPPTTTFRVSVPSVGDKPEWKLNGQTLTFTFPLQETIATVKAKINDEVGMPPGKQKLQHDSLFLKDANTLAYYNVNAATVISLQLKERGGRKK